MIEDLDERGMLEDTLVLALGEFPENLRAVVATGRSEKRTKKTSTITVLGLKMATISPELRQRFKLDDKAKGVVVTGVGADSPAAAQVRPGDIIRNVGPDLEVVTAPAQVKDKVDVARKNKMKRIVLLIVSGQDSRFVSLALTVAGDGSKDKDKEKG